MGVYENLLPGKENALTPEYLTVKPCFQCSDASKTDRRRKNARPAKSYYQTQLRLEDIIFLQQETRWKSESLFVL
ncbi:MAG: hypothetical protein ACLTS6_04140 [Anaerobutyricum sp.]